MLILGHFETSLLSYQQILNTLSINAIVDARKVILCIALVSFFSEIFMVIFEVEICLSPTFQETVGSHLKLPDYISLRFEVIKGERII